MCVRCTFFFPLESICLETLTIFTGNVNLFREGTLHLNLLWQMLLCLYRELSEFATAAVTKYHKLGGLTIDVKFLSVLEARSPRSRRQQVGSESLREEFVLGLCPWHLEVHLLPMSLHISSLCM